MTRRKDPPGDGHSRGKDAILKDGSYAKDENKKWTDHVTKSEDKGSKENHEEHDWTKNIDKTSSAPYEKDDHQNSFEDKDKDLGQNLPGKDEQEKDKSQNFPNKNEQEKDDPEKER